MVIKTDGFFYPILTQIMDSFSCSPLNTTASYFKKAPRVPECADMRHILGLYHFNITIASLVFGRASVHFYTFH